MTPQDHHLPSERPAARDSLGCAVSTLGPHREIAGRGFVIYRKVHSDTAPSRVETQASGRGLLAGVSLGPGHRRCIFEGSRGTDHHFAPDSSYVRPFLDPYRADILTGFDFILIEISQEALDSTCADLGLPPADGLSCTPGTEDTVLAGLARALLPALAAPEDFAPLFVDHVVASIGIHLATRHHGGRPHPARAGGLGAAHLRRAQEMMAAALDGDLQVGDIATACGVSRSHLIRGFRTATGVTPYQWLLRQRIERARDLLLSTRLPLADIALACGFSDQSHMTRTFSRLTGLTPGAWRRKH